MDIQFVTATSKKGRCCNIDHWSRQIRSFLRSLEVTEFHLCQSASMNNKCQPVNSQTCQLC